MADEDFYPPVTPSRQRSFAWTWRVPAKAAAWFFPSIRLSDRTIPVIWKPLSRGVTAKQLFRIGSGDSSNPQGAGILRATFLYHGGITRRSGASGP